MVQPPPPPLLAYPLRELSAKGCRVEARRAMPVLQLHLRFPGKIVKKKRKNSNKGTIHKMDDNISRWLPMVEFRLEPR